MFKQAFQVWVVEAGEAGTKKWRWHKQEWNIVLIGHMDFVWNSTDNIVAGTVPLT